MTGPALPTAILGERGRQLFVGGEWTATDTTFPVFDPATHQQIATCSDAGASEIAAATDAASRAFPSWSSTSADTRAEVLLRVHALATRHGSELAALLTAEQGKPLREADGEIAYGALFAQWYAEEGRRVYGRTARQHGPGGGWLHYLPQPLGVVAAVTPWNYPFVLVMRKLCAAIAAGCTVVLKPSELTPLSGLAIAGLFSDAGLPRGVLNVVTTRDPVRFADAVIDDPRVRKLSFTGSAAVGRQLASAAGRTLTRLGLELGGHNPFIIFPDASVDLAVEAAVTAKLRNGGQTCVATNRIYVHREIAEEFAKAYALAMGSTRVGVGTDPSTGIGPLITPAAVDRVHHHVAEAVGKGAHVLTGGDTVKVPGAAAGAFYAPTVLVDVDDSMSIMAEETFGPVAPVLTFADADEVLGWANDSPYGLAAYVYTNDLRTALTTAERLETGIVAVNKPAPSGVAFPQGGIKQSGIGYEGGPEGLREFMYDKYITIGI